MVSLARPDEGSFNMSDIPDIIEDSFRQKEDIFEFDIVNHRGVFVATHVREDRLYVIGDVSRADTILGMGEFFKNLGYNTIDHRDSDRKVQTFCAYRRAA